MVMDNYVKPLDMTGVLEWIIDTGLRGLKLEEQVEGFCERLIRAGLPARRFNLAIGTLHPIHGARTFVWKDGALVAETFERGNRDRGEYTKNPIYYMRKNGVLRMRQRLDTGKPQSYPLLDEFAAAGMTEYAARIDAFERPKDGEGPLNLLSDKLLPGVFLSCTTDAPGGFDDGHLAQVDAVLPAFALAVKARSTFDVASTVLETYLGSDAGQRVLTGQIDRNVFHRLHAVIWLCDLRGFSTVANEVEHDEFVEILDAYLELMARPVLDQGGQILKFLGDGFLATFELEEGHANTACDDTIRALDALRAQAPAFNASRGASGKRTLDFGVALHVGDVLYGNIGTRERLDFTVVGTAVNETSRIERLCKPLGQQVLMSHAFKAQAHSSRHRMVPLGKHALQGISAAQALFTIAAPNAA